MGLRSNKGKPGISARDWETLYRRHFQRTRRYLTLRLSDRAEAEELAQEVFLALAGTRIPTEPLPYILAIARNVLAQHLRRQAAERAALAEYLRRSDSAKREARGAQAPEEGPQGDSLVQIKDILRAAARHLPPRDAELVTLRFLDGLSVKQVARQLSCSEEAVRKRIERLRVVLRRLWRE